MTENQNVLRLRKVVQRTSETITVYSAAENAFLKPENGNLYFQVFGEKPGPRQEKLLKLKFWRVDLGTRPIVHRVSNDSTGYIPERYILADLSEPEIEISNPIMSFE